VNNTNLRSIIPAAVAGWGSGVVNRPAVTASTAAILDVGRSALIPAHNSIKSTVGKRRTTAGTTCRGRLNMQDWTMS